MFGAPPLEFEYDVQSVDDTLGAFVSTWVRVVSCVSGTHRDVTEDGQQDVDEEVGVATALEEDTQRWEDDGKKDLADVAGVLSASMHT